MRQRGMSDVIATLITADAMAALIAAAVYSVLAFLALLTLTLAGYAHDNGQYADAPQAVRDWYRNAQLTEAAQKRIGFKSCCAHSDVVKTTSTGRAAPTSGYWLPAGASEFQQVPPDIIHWGESAPDGQPTLFATGALPTCFYPGQSGQ